MKLVTYNFHFGGKIGPQGAWPRIWNELEPDLLFSQESFAASIYQPEQHWKSEIWQAAPNRPWGSGIVSRSDSLEKIDVAEFEGLVTGARLRHATTNRIFDLFSVHVPNRGPYVSTANKILDQIAKVSDRGADLIIAGDFNVTMARRHSSEVMRLEPGEEALLYRLRDEFNLENAWQSVHPDQPLPQTLRWAGNRDTRYHCDAIFLPVSRMKVRSAHVVQQEWEEMSDHFPLSATFSLE